eukprot:UN21864
MTMSYQAANSSPHPHASPILVAVQSKCVSASTAISHSLTPQIQQKHAVFSFN